MAEGAAEKKRTKRIRVVPPIMVLKECSDSRLFFQFRSLLWGFGTGPIASLLCIFAWKVSQRQDIHQSIHILVYFLAIAFTYSTIYSLTSSRSLEIDFVRRVVNLHTKTLLSKKNRSEGFDRFKCIRVNRSTNTVNHRKSLNYFIALEYKDGWAEYLGWSEFGAMSLAKAMDLANKIAPQMGIEINAPTYFEEKPLKGKGVGGAGPL